MYRVGHDVSLDEKGVGDGGGWIIRIICGSTLSSIGVGIRKIGV
jgi:hypothetical protein